MTNTMVRCDACIHDPGPSPLCHVGKKHAYRAWRRCEGYDGVPEAPPFDPTAPKTDTPEYPPWSGPLVCGECAHRSPTGTCFYWTNQDKEIKRVDSDLSCDECGAFKVKRSALQ